MMELNEIIASLLDQAQDRDSSIDENDPDCIFRKDAAALRAAAELLQKAYGANEPLTMDELREMDGEPVWVERYGYGKQYALVNCWWKSQGIIHLTYFNGASDMANNFLTNGGKIYRRKPEEVNP